MTTGILWTNQNLKKFQSDMMQELTRIASFDRWQDGDTPSPLALARSGFTYSGQGHKVFCLLCKMELDNLKRGDDPLEEHKKRSPQCQFTNRVSTVNRSPDPIAAPPEASEGGALWGVYSSALRRSQGKNRPTDSTPNAILNPSVRVDRLNPDYELLRRERIRLDTFYDWPSSAHANPQVLAREGLFYTGSIDRVRCAFCHSTLHTWVQGDDPREEHRKYFPQCPFVLNLDVGNVRIEDDAQLENAGQNLPSLTGNVTTGASAGQTGAMAPSVEAFMNTPTVRAVLEMGFSVENVKQVVQQHLADSGEFFPNAEAVVEHLLSMGVSQLYSASSAQTNTPSSSAATSASSVAASSSSSLASSAASASPVAVASSVASASLGSKTEETNTPQNEVAKKGTGSGKKRRRGARKEKMAASSEVSSSSQAGSSEPQAVPAEPSSRSTAAAANFPGDENHGDPEELQLLDENSRLKEARTCKVCMDREVNTVFLPCGHLICCDVCSPKVRNCPLCRTFIRGTVKTYLS